MCLTFLTEKRTQLNCIWSSWRRKGQKNTTQFYLKLRTEKRTKGHNSILSEVPDGEKDKRTQLNCIWSFRLRKDKRTKLNSFWSFRLRKGQKDTTQLYLKFRTEKSRKGHNSIVSEVPYGEKDKRTQLSCIWSSISDKNNYR